MIMKGLESGRLDKLDMLLYLHGGIVDSEQESSIYLYGKNREQARMVADSQRQRLELIGSKTLEFLQSTTQLRSAVGSCNVLN
jgi:hypothetical protein